jgi:Lrp/AsnC family transcriptional regulator for asnA, asnC and gidA
MPKEPARPSDDRAAKTHKSARPRVHAAHAVTSTSTSTPNQAKKREPLDALDRAIIDALRKDGRASNSDVAQELGVTEGTIRARVKKLLSSGVFRVQGLLNPEVMPELQVCVVGLNVEESKSLESLAHKISRLPEVRSVAIVTGRYDLLAEVVVPSNKGLIHFLSHSLSRVSGVQSSETFLLLSTIDKWI